MKTWKRMMGLVLSMALMASIFPISALAEVETDDPTTESNIVINLDDVDHASQSKAVLLGAALSGMIVKDGITRAEWMKDLVLLFGMSITADEYPDIYFPDISESTEYFSDIMTAVKYGVVSIEAGDNFEPEAPLTREFAAQTLNARLGMMKTSESYTYNDTAAVEFQDDAQVAVELGWFALVDGDFMPEQEVTSTELNAMCESVVDTLARRDVSSAKHEYEFASYVKTIPASASVDSVIDTETGTRTLTISGYSDTLEADDTFAYYFEDFAFVFSAASVQKNGDVYTVVTKDAPADAIINFEFTGELTPEIEFVPDETPVTLMSADGDSVTFSGVRLLAKGKDFYDFSRHISLGNGITGELTGKVYNIRLETKFVPGGDKRAVLRGDVEVKSTLEVDFLNDPAAKGLSLGSLSLEPFGSVGLELSLKMNARLGYYYKASFAVGAEKINGRGAPVREWKSSDDCYLFADGTISAQLAVAAYLDFGPWGKAHARIGAGPIIKMGYKRYSGGTPIECITESGYLYAGASASVTFKEAVSGQIVYQDSWNLDFYNEKNSPIRFYTHVEDGHEVPSCTRGKDSGTTGGSYSTPKYTTPSNSRYYASARSNASSTGYGGYGTTTPVVIWETSDNDDGTVTITGYKGGASLLNIPETIDGKTVTKIGASAFKKKHSVANCVYSRYSDEHRKQRI